MWIGNLQDVTGLDDQAPAGPDGTSAHQSSVLGERELLGGTVEVGDTGDDKGPLLESAFCYNSLSRNIPNLVYPAVFVKCVESIGSNIKRKLESIVPS